VTGLKENGKTDSEENGKTDSEENGKTDSEEKKELDERFFRLVISDEGIDEKKLQKMKNDFWYKGVCSKNAAEFLIRVSKAVCSGSITLSVTHKSLENFIVKALKTHIKANMSIGHHQAGWIKDKTKIDDCNNAIIKRVLNELNDEIDVIDPGLVNHINLISESISI